MKKRFRHLLVCLANTFIVINDLTCCLTGTIWHS